MKRRCLAGLLLLLISINGWAQNDEFSLNFKDVDIRALIETVADATGKNFVVDPRITGNVTVVTATPMKAAQVYDVFLSILKVHGYAAVASGNVIKIIPNTNVKQDGEQSELRSTGKNPDDQYTQVVHLQHIDVNQAVAVLQPLVPQYAFMGAVPTGNAIILSDTRANVERLQALIKQIDKSNVHKIEIVQLQNAKASDLVQPLNTLLNNAAGGQATAGTPPLVADDRTNSIVIGGNPDQHLQIRALIASLDAPVQRDGNTEVIRMRYALAKDLVETLTGISGSKNKKGEAVKGQSAAEKGFDIRADEASNALIITAPQDEMRNLKSVVRQLDVRRAQVHIEAIIAEVSYGKAQELGVEWQTREDGRGVFGARRKDAGADVDISKFISTLGKGLSVGYFAGSELKALINAFANDKDVNILSTPSIVTLDNEEASIMVGQNIPLVTGNFSTNTNQGGGNPFQTIQREDVGIKLKVLPQINEGDAVKLKVTQEVSSVDPSTTGASLQTNKRLIETSVVVDDGRVLVLGGLIKDDVKETVDKVPLLADIPLLGYLFQTNNTQVEKTNLMVFLRPLILRDERKASEFSERKYEDIRDKQLEFNREGLLLMPDQPQPQMAPLPQESTPSAPILGHER